MPKQRGSTYACPAVTTFPTGSRPALRGAACGGRPRAGSDTTVTGEPAPPDP
jgi:hypothetical protein